MHFWGHIFRKKKRAFWLLAPPKQMPFLTISNKNIFFKTQGTRLGAIVTPNKCLEYALIRVSHFQHPIKKVGLNEALKYVQLNIQQYSISQHNKSSATLSNDRNVPGITTVYV